MRFHTGNLFCAHAVGSSRLHCKLCDGKPIKGIIYHFEHFGKKIIRQTGRRSPADIDTLNRKTERTHILRCGREIACQHVHKGPQFLPPRQKIRREGAVEAARETKRNADVDTHRSLCALREERQLTHGHLRDELRLWRAAVIVVLQPRDDLRRLHAGAQPSVHDLCRPHPMQDPPRRGSSGKAHLEKSIEISFHGAVHGSACDLIGLPLRIEIKFLTAPVQRKEKDLGHNRRRLTSRLPVDHRQLGVIRLSRASDDLHLEQSQYLSDDFNNDFGAAVDAERPDSHVFFFSRHFLQMPKNFA